MIPILKKAVVWAKRRLDQISECGVQTLCKKIRKLFRLIFMNIFASLAVYLKINWPKACDFVDKKNRKKLKRLYKETNSDMLAVKEIEDQRIRYLKTSVDRGPILGNEQNWLIINRSLAGLYLTMGRMEEMNDVLKKDAEVQCNIAKQYNFDDLGIEFLSQFLAVASIGTYEFLETYIKAQMLGLCPSKKLILLVDSKASINNSSYLNYWRRYITIVSNPRLVKILSPLQKRFESPLNYYMLLNEKVHKSFLALGIVREQWINEERQPILTLTDEDYNRGWQKLKFFGMKQGDWFVCVHVREGGWKDNNSPAENFRNGDIDTYKLAIKAVTDAGGWVIRMGDSTMKPLEEMPQVIDYARSDEKSDWMDVFLCAQCRFFIGTSSGLFILAITFGVPIVATNFLPTCGAYYLTSNDLFIPRICKSKKEGRSLNFIELFSPLIGTAAIQNRYDRENVEVIENSEEEIKDLVDEMLERFNGCLEYSKEDEDLQKSFRAITMECGKLYGEENAVVNARVGRKFLNKYKALLSSKKKDIVEVGK